jgi:hypothetical protein
MGNPISSTGTDTETSKQPPTPQPAAPPKAPTSSGDVAPSNKPAPPDSVAVGSNEKTGFELKKEQALANAGVSTPPQKMNREY